MTENDQTVERPGEHAGSDTALRRPDKVNPWLAPVVIGLLHVGAQLFILFVLDPPALDEVLNPRLYDEKYFHLHAIHAFADQMPVPDLSDYRAATTPLYHLVLALISLIVGSGELPMRLVSGLFPLALSMLLARVIAGRVSTVSAVALTVPIMCSPYIFSAAVWALPDAAAWLGVVGVLLICLRPKFDDVTLVVGSIAVLLLVLTRQVHLWAASTLWLAAWLGGHNASLASRSIAGLPIDDVAKRARRTTVAMIATAPAFISVAWFIWIWGGLVPPEFQNAQNAAAASVGEGNAAAHTGPNLATPAFFLAVVGMISPFYFSAMIPEIRARLANIRAATPVLASVALVGFLLAVVVPTDFDPAEGRRTGLWNLHNALTDIVPFIEIADRSLLIAALAALGAVTLLIALGGCELRQRWIIGGAMLAFVAAQSANLQCWQRYHEPMAAVVLSLCVAFGRRAPPRWAFVGPVVLGLVLSGIMALYLYRTDQTGTEPELESFLKDRPAMQSSP